jgi:hypothetical protein
MNSKRKLEDLSVSEHKALIKKFYDEGRLTNIEIVIAQLCFEVMKGSK